MQCRASFFFFHFTTLALLTQDGNDVPLTELVDRTLKLSLPNNILCKH